jgi:hypothetical protein
VFQAAEYKFKKGNVLISLVNISIFLVHKVTQFIQSVCDRRNLLLTLQNHVGEIIQSERLFNQFSSSTAKVNIVVKMKLALFEIVVLSILYKVIMTYSKDHLAMFLVGFHQNQKMPRCQKYRVNMETTFVILFFFNTNLYTCDIEL